jgi:hypothetical protein
VLLRLAHRAARNTFALLRLLPMGDRDKDIEIRVPRTLMGLAIVIEPYQPLTIAGAVLFAVRSLSWWHRSAARLRSTSRRRCGRLGHGGVLTLLRTAAADARGRRGDTAQATLVTLRNVALAVASSRRHAVWVSDVEPRPSTT